MNNYVIVGAGGTGSHLLRPLHLYLSTLHKGADWLLHIIDGDVVETKNLDRQLFPAGAVTLNKAEAAAAMLNDEQHVVGHAVYLSEDNLTRFIQEDDTVLIAVDNFTVRKRIEDHASSLKNVAVINGGNERYDGSVQLWVRKNGRNITPRLSYLHPELRIGEGEDRAEMTCAQAAALPGGEQTIIANLQSATWMLTALWRKDIELYGFTPDEPSHRSWTELQFDVLDGTVQHIDQRMSSHWNDTPPPDMAARHEAAYGDEHDEDCPLCGVDA